MPMKSSLHVNGTLHGLPVLSTNRLTAYFPHPKRGAEAQDFEMLPASNGEHLRTRYDTILSKAEAGNPPRPCRPGTRGWVKQSPACNLIRRLRERRNEVLRFLTDLRVPFDKNQAERDLRMPKFKQEVSGCFRSKTGVDAFAIIRSYLSTLRKQSDDLFNSLVLTF